MASSINNNTTVTWKNINLHSSNDLHAIYRSGQYACMFDNYVNKGITVRIVDLAKQNIIKIFQCQLEESLVAFRYPHVVTKQAGIFRIWDASSIVFIPKQTIYSKIRGVQAVDIKDNTLAVLSTQYESMVPNYVTVIRDIMKVRESIKVFRDGEIDVGSGLLIVNDLLVYSIICGTVVIRSIDNFELIKIISLEIGLNKPIKNNSEEKIENRIVRSLVADNKTLVGLTGYSIKVWNIVTGCPLKEFPVEREPGFLLSLENRFLFGCIGKTAKIWDIVTGKVLHQEDGTSPCKFPSFTLYRNAIYRLGRLDAKDITIQLPSEKEETKVAETQSQSTSTSEISKTISQSTFSKSECAIQ